MGKHCRCVTGICDNYIRYPELRKKYSSVDGDIIMYKLKKKDGALRAAWINTNLKGRKQVIQESLHTFVTPSLLGYLIKPSPVFNKINPSPVRYSK